MKNEKKTILVVDDSKTNLAVAEEGLEEWYEVLTVSSGARMFNMLNNVTPDLILLDIEMPEMDGFQALEKLKSDPKYKDIPVMFLTSFSDETTQSRGFEMGVVDFVSKPFSIPVLMNRIKIHTDMAGLIKQRTKELENTHRSLLFVLADIVESRDKGTGGHVDRTTRYIKLLINHMIKNSVYQSELLFWDMENIHICAALHDVGKIEISDTILNKPSKLTSEEFTSMKSHVSSGAEIITRVISRTGEGRFLKNARLFAEYHHENWDGTGYPHGLKGEQIPLQGRIMAIADVYDALVSERPYKKGFTDEEAVNIIMSESGTKFDPAIAKAFYEIRDKFAEVHKTFEDS